MTRPKTNCTVLGAGIGMIVGWLLGSAGYGLVLGAAGGLACGALLRGPDRPRGS